MCVWCMNVYLCAWVHTHVYAGVYIHAGWLLSLYLLLIWISQPFSAMLVVSDPQWSFCLYPISPKHGVTDTNMDISRFFGGGGGGGCCFIMWVLEIWTQVLTLAQQMFLPAEVSPQSRMTFAKSQMMPMLCSKLICGSPLPFNFKLATFCQPLHVQGCKPLMMDAHSTLGMYPKHSGLRAAYLCIYLHPMWWIWISGHNSRVQNVTFLYFSKLNLKDATLPPAELAENSALVWRVLPSPNPPDSHQAQST